jgi:phenylacetate-CoA ligase
MSKTNKTGRTKAWPVHSPNLREANSLARVAATVPRWLNEVPLYRKLNPVKRCPEAPPEFFPCFQSLPIISKKEIRHEFPHNFLRPGIDLQELLDQELVELESTSGTAEEPTPLLLAQGWWNEQEYAALRLNPLVDQALRACPHPRRVTLTSPSCNHDICYKGVPSRSDRIIGDSLSINLSRHPFFWTDHALARMGEEIREWEPLFLDVDPVYGALFARYCLRQGIRVPSLRFVISSYEYLSLLHRRILERAFGVPVFNLYGSTETGHLLMEDQQARMIPSVATAFLEVIQVDEDGIGELVTTTLSNEYMPLIRYAIGDLVQRQSASDPSTYLLHGRSADALRQANGKRITVQHIDACIARIPHGLLHYQLRQESPHQFTLFYVTEDGGIDAAARSLLETNLGQLLGDNRRLKLQAVDYLPCENSGKFRLVRPLPARNPDDNTRRR